MQQSLTVKGSLSIRHRGMAAILILAPERDCVVSTNRSISAKPEHFLVRSLLRLVLRTTAVQLNPA